MTDWATIGTPVSTAVGGGAGLDSAMPLPRTLLSLSRYAHIMGINPMSFWGAVAKNSDGDYITGGAACSEIWYQYDWQDADKVSRTALALAILDAENDIMQITGKLLAPMWIVEEVHKYPAYHRVEYDTWYGADGRRKSLTTKFSPVIAPGRRGVTLIDDVSPTYLDLDSDGFFETARVSVATTLTDPNEIKVYITGESGNEEWEIRPCRSKSISAGVFTADFYTWQFIDPDLWEAMPVQGAEMTEIDLSGNPPGNVVSTVDIYREYNDETEASAQFLWEAQQNGIAATGICSCCGGTGCTACGLTTQDGCFDVRNAEIGEVAPWPGTYSSTDSAWESDSYTVCAEPDMVKLWYFAGEYNQRFLRGTAYDSLPDKWARVIARMATARLSKPLCACGNLNSLVEYLSEDISLNLGDKSHMVDFDVLANPFGTRRGEIEAWMYVRKTLGSGISGVAL
jgi:hypothetical protein